MIKKHTAGALMTAIATVVLASTACASGVGTTGANFLKVAVGPRAAAMGEAYTAVADDGSALYWNPAGLARLPGSKLFASYNLWFEGIAQGYLGYSSPLAQGGFAVGLNYVDLGTMQGYDEDGFPTDTFGASDFLLQGGYAQGVSPDFALGISAGYLSSTISDANESTFAATVGLVHSTNGLDLGAAIQHLGPALGQDPLPLTYRAGLAKDFGQVLVTADLVAPSDNYMYACGGAELHLSPAVALRAGYRSGRDIGSGISAGLGFSLGNIALDYAYVPYAELGDTHRFALQVGLN